MIAALIAGHGLAANSAEPEQRDQGWMAHNKTGSCEMIRTGENIEPSDSTHQQLSVHFINDPRQPRDRYGAELMLMLGLYGEQGAIKNPDVQSFSILEGAADSASRLDVDGKLSIALGGKAKDALRLFATERLVRVKRADGTTSVFRLPIKGYAASKAMFDACIRASRAKT